MARRRRELIAELAAERRDAGLSQTEVAARMGTSQSAVARLEAGDGDLRMSTLERYAAALGRPIHWRLAASASDGRDGPEEPGDAGAEWTDHRRGRRRGEA
ncbi:MAG: helix-turn-helix domain-containing protein [Streptosporangiales bacterium]|nr:helix-turn-helix domain-containing protein [Streptosporangiales bacterium]